VKHCAAIVALPIACWVGTVQAQGADPGRYPVRPIRIVVPFAAGGPIDATIRLIADKAKDQLGTIVIENRPGAGGGIGVDLVAKAPPDGLTLGVAAVAMHAINPWLYSKLPYDPIKDFVGVSYLGNSGYVIAAPGGLGVNTLADYVKLAKGKPGQFNYASAGNGSATHLGMAYFLAKAGLDMQHIPMKSTGDAVNEVVAGRAQGVTTSLIGIAGFKGDARIKPLAYTGTQRSRFMPELPTVAEAGVPGYKFDSWFGLLAPAGTPRAEIDRINNAMAKVMADPAVQERFVRLGVEAGTLSPDEFQKLLRADYEQAAALVKASGAKLD